MTTEDFILHGCRENPFVRLPGFHVSMVVFDWLHVIDLTIIPDCVATALVELTSVPEGQCVFAGHDQETRLRTAYVEFCRLCKTHKIRISIAAHAQRV